MTSLISVTSSSPGDGPALALMPCRLVRLPAVLSIVILAALAEGCFLGRNLYLTEESPLEQEVNATASVNDGGVEPSADAVNAADGQAPPATMPGTTKPDAMAPDGAPPNPGPMPNCVGGTAAEVEPNGTIDLARPLVLGKTCGALTLGDADWFTMDMGQTGNLRVTFEADGDARLLMQSAGGGITFATGTGGAFNFTTNGIWNLRVVSDTGRVQGYALVRPQP